MKSKLVLAFWIVYFLGLIGSGVAIATLAWGQQHASEPAMASGRTPAVIAEASPAPTPSSPWPVAPPLIAYPVANANIVCVASVSEEPVQLPGVEERFVQRRFHWISCLPMGGGAPLTPGGFPPT